jgi:ArsR family transcriptional regulator
MQREIPDPSCLCLQADRTLSEPEAAQLELLLATIADRTRLRILSIFVRAGGEPVCACRIVPELGLTQPTVSYHLKQLAQAGLLARERRGAFIDYSLVPGALTPVAGLIAAVDGIAARPAEASVA